MPRRRRRPASLPSAAKLALAAPQVIALRSARMLAAGSNPSAADRREMRRMGTEKTLAFWESMNAMGWALLRANQDYALLAMRQWWLPWLGPWQMASAASRVLEKGLAPVQRRAAANARRLRR